MHTEEVQIANRVVIPASAPGRVLVVPWGNVQSKSGDFVIDDKAAQAICAAFDRHGTKVPIDIHHQTLGGKHASPTGGAPAVGWITSLEAVHGAGIFASVEWTEEGAAHIQSKRYRYLSPVITHVHPGGRVTGLHSVAFTNKPAIKTMHPIVNSASADDGEDVQQIVNQAVAEWDAHPHVQGICTRQEYIDQALREGETTAAGDARAAQAPEPSGDRAALIRHACSEWGDDSFLQQMVNSQREYVGERLLVNGLAGLTETEGITAVCA